jgi:predicted ribosomally synthesized peptide with nif11-like leader
MSLESAKAFYNRLTTDEVLRKKLQNADSNEKFLALVADAGYSFTRKEWETVLVSVSMMSGSQSSQLSATVVETISWGLWGLSPELSDRESSSTRPLQTIRQSLTQKLKFLQPQRIKSLFQFSSWSIKTKFLVVLLSLVLVPMSLSIYYNSQRNFKNSTEKEFRQLELLASSYADYLDRLIVDIQQVIIQLSTDSNLIDFLSSSDANKQKTLSLSIQKRLDNILRSSSNYDAVYALDLDGRCFAATDPSFVGQNYTFREYFQQAAQGRSYISSILIGTTSKRPGVYFSNPIRNQTGRIVGVAVAKLKGEAIWETIARMSSGSQSYAFLVDREGIIISHPDRSFLYKSLVSLPPKTLVQIESDKRYGISKITSSNLPDLAAAIVNAKGIGHTSYYSSPEQGERIAGFAPLDMQPWTLVISQPKTQLVGSSASLSWENVFALSFVAAIATILALILSKNIAEPIHCLTKAARELEQGNFQPHDLVKVSCFRDDIGKLVRVFLHMAQQIKAREENSQQQKSMQIEVDEAKKARQVAEVTQTEYFQQLQKKAQRFKNRAQNHSNPELDYVGQLQEQLQKLKKR